MPDRLTATLIGVVQQLDANGQSELGVAILASSALRRQLDTPTLQQLERVVYQARKEAK